MSIKGAFSSLSGSAGRLLSRYAGPQDDRSIDVLYGLRVLFILIIAWYHIWQQSWLTPVPFGVSLDFLLRSGYEWVDAMLLLSGFLLYLPCADGREVKPAAFYKKRIIRIVPSYYLCMLVLLLVVVIPGRGYSSFLQAGSDLMAHMTFIHTLFPYTYVSTPLNGVLWTLAVEGQFYLLFPFLARAFRKKPLITYLLMAGAAFIYRGWAAGQQDTALLINQLPAFLDVYANGFAAAMAYTEIKKYLGDSQGRFSRVFFTAVAGVCVWGIVILMKDQAASPSIEQLRLGQMSRRYGFSVLVSVMMVSLSFSLAGIRFILGNRVMRFLSGVTFQFYMYHQAIAVQLKKWHFPSYVNENPNMASEQPWQTLYTLCVFGVTLLLSAALTLLFEKPVTALLSGKRKKATKEKADT